jgi:PAS domain S-box-containing protein
MLPRASSEKSGEEMRETTILIVDDRPENLQALEAILKRPGHRLFSAHSGQEALALLLQHDFAVVLLDVRMPDMDGFETAEWIRRRVRSMHTPIIFVTAGDASPDHIARGYAVGAVDFIFKPFPPEVLRAKVGIFIELHAKTLELQAGEERFRTLVHNIPGAIYRCAAMPPWPPSFVSEAIKTTTGFAPADFMERRVRFIDMVHPFDVAAVEQAVTAAVRDRRPFGVEYRITHRNGELRWVFDRGRAAYGPDGAPLHIDGVLVDTTERRQAEEELRLRKTELETINRELDAFCYTVSHDLRAPLRAITGLSQVLRLEYGPALDARGADFTQRIADACTRMDGMIQDLLAYSRLTRDDIQLGMVDLQALAREAMQQLRADIEDRDAVIEVDEPLPRAFAHSLTLRLALVNLLSNAMKFVAPGTVPRVRVRGETVADRVRLSVEDNGIGIAPEHQERIFGLFQRLHPDSAYPGTGIGLAIVRRAVERMGGTVGVESRPGQGSRFWIEIAGARRMTQALDLRHVTS